MRILHVTPVYHPAVDFGGPIMSMQEVNRGLCANGADVDVITTNAHLNGNLNVPLGVWVEDGHGVRIQYQPRVGASAYCFSPKQLEFLVRNYRDYDAFCISALFTFSSAIFSLLARQARLRYWVSPRAAINRKRRAALKAVHLSLFEKSLYRNAKFIHVTSLQEESELRSVGLGPNFVLAPNAVNELSPSWPTSVISLAPDGSRRAIETNEFLENLGQLRFFYFGTISPLKNLESVIEAFARVSSGRSASLVLVGPDYRGERGRLQNKYASLQRSVVFVDRMERVHIQAIAPKLGVSIHASLGENFSNSLMEVSQLHLPAIVSTEVGALQFLTDEGVVTFDPFRAGDLDRALEYAFENYDRLRGEATRRKVSLPSWKDCGRLLLDALDQGI